MIHSECGVCRRERGVQQAHTPLRRSSGAPRGTLNVTRYNECFLLSLPATTAFTYLISCVLSSCIHPSNSSVVHGISLLGSHIRDLFHSGFWMCSRALASLRTDALPLAKPRLLSPNQWPITFVRRLWYSGEHLSDDARNRREAATVGGRLGALARLKGVAVLVSSWRVRW